MSHYNPTLGGVNCAYFVDGECKSRMSNGESWQTYWGKNNTIACPKELPFGTQIMIDNVVYTCRDRGGMIIESSGVYWVDILADKTPYYYGEEKLGYIIP